MARKNDLGRNIDEAFLPDFAVFGSQRHFWSVAAHIQVFSRTRDDLVKRSLSLSAFQDVMEGIGCVSSFCHALIAKRRGVSVASSLSVKNSTKFLKRAEQRSGSEMIAHFGLEAGVTRLETTEHGIAALVREWIPRLPHVFVRFAEFDHFHRTPYNRLRHGNCTFSRASVMWPRRAVDRSDVQSSQLEDCIFLWETDLDIRSPERVQFRRHLISSSSEWMRVLLREATNCALTLSYLTVAAVGTYHESALPGVLIAAEERYRLLAATKRQLAKILGGA